MLRASGFPVKRESCKKTKRKHYIIISKTLCTSRSNFDRKCIYCRSDFISYFHFHLLLYVLSVVIPKNYLHRHVLQAGMILEVGDFQAIFAGLQMRMVDSAVNGFGTDAAPHPDSCHLVQLFLFLARKPDPSEVQGQYRARSTFPKLAAQQIFLDIIRAFPFSF